MQPAMGDLPVCSFRHVDAVPADVRRWVGAHTCASLAALLLQVEVVAALSPSAAASSQSRAETCIAPNHIQFIQRPQTGSTVLLYKLRLTNGLLVDHI
jgi:hypothetical protein